MAFLEKLLRSKVFVWILLVLPGLWPAWPIFVRPDPSVGADPLKYILHHYGFTACVLLAVVLAFTPLRVLWPKWGVAQAVNRHRRLVGVASFAYALLHLTAHVIYETALDFSQLGHVFEVALTKPFQLVGLAAFAILLLLAITSPHAAVKALGGKRWKLLHRLAYVAAALAAYHQAIAQKLFPMQVVWIFGPLLLLEIARVIRDRSTKGRVEAQTRPR